MKPVFPSEISEEAKQKYGRDGNPATPKDVRGLPNPRKHIDVKEYAERYSKEELLEMRDFQASRWDYYTDILETGKQIPKWTEQHSVNIIAQTDHLMDQYETAMYEAGYIPG